MRVTPLDLRNHRFPRRWTGYAQEEVDEFLRLVAEDYEAVLREVEAQRDQLIQLEARLEVLSANEKILRDTLTTAQTLSEDLKRTTIKTAEVLVSESEIKDRQLLDAAHRHPARAARPRRSRPRRLQLPGQERRAPGPGRPAQLPLFLGLLRCLDAPGRRPDRLGA